MFLQRIAFGRWVLLITVTLPLQSLPVGAQDEPSPSLSPDLFNPNRRTSNRRLATRGNSLAGSCAR